MWLVVASGAAAAVWLVLSEEAKPANAVALAALGWSPAALRAGSWIASFGVAVAVFVGTAAGGSGSLAVQATVAVAIWLPIAVPRLIRALLMAAYRNGRDMALMLWLRRIRLYAASGRPIGDAALEAAERVSAPAFAPVATSVNLALAAGRDPLAAAEEHFAGSPAETLVSTLVEAERSGGAAQDVIDRLIAQAVQSIEDRRRGQIEQLARSVANASTLVAVVAGLVVMAAMLAALPQAGI